MKYIGFVDYYISEWHANNYPSWIDEISKDLDAEWQVKYVWAEKHISDVDGITTQEWCEKYGTEQCDSIAELCERSDAIVILAPSNPEKHLSYASEVLTYNKPTYIDKPFADSVKSAKAIFKIAKENNTPFFSSSALRYADELKSEGECIGIATLGGGSNLPEYIIHQAEMVALKMGVGAKLIKCQKICEEQMTFTIKYKNGHCAAMHFAVGAPFEVTITETSGTKHSKIESAFFKGLIKEMLVFFDSLKQPFESSQTLEVNRIIVAAIKATAKPDKWIKIGR